MTLTAFLVSLAFFGIVAFDCFYTVNTGKKKVFKVPQDGMVMAFCRIVKQLLNPDLKPHHLPAIATMITNFKDRYEYNAEMEDYHTILKDQFRAKSEEIQPESAYMVTPEGIELQHLLN